MSSRVVANTCRITVISAQSRADLAVPVQIAVADLLSTLVSSLGREVADEGAANGGWVLQRAGEPPLDPSVSLAASQIRDGDVLHLRTRASQMPEVAFDDVLDAVATGVLSRTARWAPAHTAVMTVCFASALLVLAIVGALLAGPGWTAAAITAGVSAVLLLLAAPALRRTGERRGPAVVAAGFAVAFATAAGAMAVGGKHTVWEFGAPQLLVGACAAVLVATVVLVTLDAGTAGFGAVVGLGVLVAAGTLVADVTTLGAAGTASLVAAVGLAVSPVLPALAFKLSRLPLPSVPTDAADLRRDTGTIDAASVLRRAAAADHYLTGLVGGVALAIAGSALVLAGAKGSAVALAIVLGLICLLRARLFAGRGQRALLLVAGGLALLAVALVQAAQVGAHDRILVVVIPAVFVSLILLALTIALPGRRYIPPWGRAADILEALLVLAVIPLAIGVMGVYGALRVAVS